jgi:hypothetical protein
MAGLVPAIHVLVRTRKTWMPGTRPGMTKFAVSGMPNRYACDNYAAACSRG